ncbi:MAG: hypothetical protein EOO20_23000, partial [Chryseobacterium sp.]
MTFELSYFWHYYATANSGNEIEILELEPSLELDKEFYRIINALDCYAPIKGEPSKKKFLRIQQLAALRLIKLIENNQFKTIDNRVIQVFEKLNGLSEQLIEHMLIYHREDFDFHQKVSNKMYVNYLSD